MTGILHDPTTVPGPLPPSERGPLPSQRRFTVIRSDRRWMVIDNVAAQTLCVCLDTVAANIIAAALNALEGHA